MINGQNKILFSFYLHYYLGLNLNFFFFLNYTSDIVKIFIKKFFKIKSERKKEKETSLVIFHPLQWWLGLCRSPQLLSLPSPTKISAIEASQSLFNWWVPRPFLLEIQWWVKFYGSLKWIKLYHVKYYFLRIRLRLVLVAREWLRWTLKRNFKNKK